MSPLVSRRVVVTRPAAQSGEICVLLDKVGAIPVLVPTIAILPPHDFEPLDRALLTDGVYEWVVFTSSNGVRSVVERCAELGVDLGQRRDLGLAAVGPSTRSTMSTAGLTAAAMPTDYRAERIPEVLGDVEGCRILLPRSQMADGQLPDLLRARGAHVDAVSAYRTEILDLTADNLETLESVDAITLTSPSTVRGLVGGLAADVVTRAVVATVGPVTSAAARGLGLRVDVEATEPTSRGLVETLDAYEGWDRSR